MGTTAVHTGAQGFYSLDGALVPWRDNQPIVMNLGCYEGALVVPLFSSEAKLRRCLDTANVHYDRWEYVVDGNRFFNEMPARINGQEVHLILDLQITPDGKSEWLEFSRN